jgi:membrane protein required for colicin V production
MILETLAKFNFLDFIILIVLFRICYIAAQTGLSIEIFKFLGVLFSTYISLHYYASVSDLIRRSFLPKEMPVEFTDFIAFVLLLVLVGLSFVIIRNILVRFVQLNAIPKINKIFGLILGIGRAYLVIGLIAFTLMISSVSYFRSSVEHSYLGSRAFTISPQTYDWLWSNIFSNFSAQEKFNPMVTETVGKFNR